MKTNNINQLLGKAVAGGIRLLKELEEELVQQGQDREQGAAGTPQKPEPRQAEARTEEPVAEQGADMREALIKSLRFIDYGVSSDAVSTLIQVRKNKELVACLAVDELNILVHDAGYHLKGKVQQAKAASVQAKQRMVELLQAGGSHQEILAHSLAMKDAFGREAALNYQQNIHEANLKELVGVLNAFLAKTSGIH